MCEFVLERASEWGEQPALIEVASGRTLTYQVAPAELEGVLLTHPAIADAAVIPVADVEAGEVPKGFVVAGEPLTDVLAFVAARVAPYKKLRAVEIVHAIPSRRPARSCAARHRTRTRSDAPRAANGR